MVYDIECLVFWIKMIHKVNEFYAYEPLHIANMNKLIEGYMGLEYVETYISNKHKNEERYFRFKVINKKKFFLIKIKYGI